MGSSASRLLSSLFLLIGTNPQKFRAMIVPSIVEKFSFAAAVAVLLMLGRVQGQIVTGAAIDLLLGVLFVVSWFNLAATKE